MIQFKPYKPLVKFSSKAMTILFLVVGVIMIGLGVYFGFIRADGYVKTTGVIVSLEEVYNPTENDIDAVSYQPTVRFTVDGTEYQVEVGTYVEKDKLGQEMKIKYDPADPTKVEADQPGFAIYLLVVGGILVAVSIFIFVKNRLQLNKLAESEQTPLLGAAIHGTETRKLYFLTDLGTAKETCRIEDANGKVLYEAVSKKFSLVADSEMEFIDHELSRSAVHYIGKTVTSSSDSIFVFDTHSTFTIDGKDVWKTLHQNGIRIETGLNGLKWAYSLYRDDVEIAQIVSTGKNVHDETEKITNAVSLYRGFYRIETKEQNLDAIFVTLFAIRKTEMMIYD